jgi:hypothetical protein
MGSLAESAFSGAVKSISPFSKEKNTGNINWGNYNYPPCLGVIHYDPDDIQNDTVRALVIRMNRVLVLTLFVCCLNMFDNIINATFYSPQASWQWVVYSGLNLTVIPAIALFIFYNGYKALALNDSEKLQRYSVFGTIQAIFYFLFTIMPFGATNGLLSFAMFNVGVYWAISIIVESAIWAYAFGVTIYSVIFVVRGEYMMLPVTTRVK